MNHAALIVSAPLFVRRRSKRGVTLVEAMIALLLLAMFMLGFMGTFLQSRRLTESSVLHAAATSLVYGIIEQIKMADYPTALPTTTVDPLAPVASLPPYVKVRINQDVDFWIQAVYTPAVFGSAPPTPLGPLTTPSPSATAASVGAVDNTLPSLPLSTVTGTNSQRLALHIWLWIDEIPSPPAPTGDDVVSVKKITLVYTYTYYDGGILRTVRDREVFLHSVLL